MAGEQNGAGDTDLGIEALNEKFGKWEAIAGISRDFFRWSGLVGLAFFGYKSIEALSGTTTVADIGLSLRTFASVKVSQLVAWMFGAGGVAYGLGQRRLRRDTVERLQGRIKRYETLVDPDRSSSSLTPRGETRPEDQP